MRSRATAVLLALALGAAACGGGDDDGESSATTAAGSATTAAPGTGGEGGEGGEAGGGGATTTAPGGGTATTGGSGGGGATATTTAPARADLANAVLRQSDFPAGWTSEPGDGGDDRSDEALERCLGLPAGGDRPEARSPDFSVGDAITQASSAVEQAPDAASVDREFAAVAGPRFLDCAARQFDASIAQESPGARFNPSRAERISFPTRGDGTTAVRLTVTLDAGGGQQLPFFADVVFVRKGLLELSFSFVNAGAPFDAGLAADLVAKVVGRA